MSDFEKGYIMMAVQMGQSKSKSAAVQTKSDENPGSRASVGQNLKS